MSDKFHSYSQAEISWQTSWLKDSKPCTERIKLFWFRVINFSDFSSNTWRIEMWYSNKVTNHLSKVKIFNSKWNLMYILYSSIWSYLKHASNSLFEMGFIISHHAFFFRVALYATMGWNTFWKRIQVLF